MHYGAICDKGAVELPYTFTPAQRRWIDALRSGNFKQVKRNLTHAGRFCCLGVACTISEISLDKRWKQEKCLSDFAVDVQQELGLRDEVGRFINRFEVGKKGKNVSSLAAANDEGCTFAEIADFIEAHPEEVFVIR